MPAKIEAVQGARVLIVWNGSRLELRANVAPLVQIAMCEGALKIALESFFTKGPGPAGIEDLLRGGA
jgi:hypothetical protein